MTASNINVEEFINVLIRLYEGGTKVMNLDMLPDDNHPSMNKLVIHPVEDGVTNPPLTKTRKLFVKNPSIDTGNDDIFNEFNKFI